MNNDYSLTTGACFIGLVGVSIVVWVLLHGGF